MRVAIEGCLHGELQQVYHQITALQHKIKLKIDVLIICGDIQSLRNFNDLEDMHCPDKYKSMGTFIDYYEGRKKAPLLTILIGGNHEAVNSLRQSYFGGWLAHNIYYLGQTGSVLLRKGSQCIRVTGASGIFKSNDFKYTTRLERYPLKGKDKITAYHAKQLDLLRLELLARISAMQQAQPQTYGHFYNSFDIALSHDWPKDIALYGDMQQLLKVKPFLKKEIDDGSFGSGPMLRFLQTARPAYWFSAHMHVKYAAIYPHPDHRYTHFLALDKVLGRRNCIQMVELGGGVGDREEVRVEVDPTWIGVLLLTQPYMLGNEQLYYLDKQQAKISSIKLMNGLIKDFPLLKERLEAMPPYSFNPAQSQAQQSEHFLRHVGIEAKQLNRVCFDREWKEEAVQDEIDLDL